VKWFKKIKHTNFSIDIVGNVINNNTNKIMRPAINKGGYYEIPTKNKNGSRRKLLIHREVAKLFCDNKNNLPIVNHIDGNKLNNHASNLEWCTIQENTIHAYDIGLNSLAVKVKLIDLKTNITKNYRSMQALGYSIGIDDRLLIGRIKRSKKYPILGRYVIKIIPPALLFQHSNSLNHGKPLYVYDYITNKTTKYDSLGQAMYATGVRSPLDTSKDFLRRIGFVISFKPITEIPDIGKNKEFIISARVKYYSKDYRKKTTIYYVIDLLSKDKKEYEFTNTKDVKSFMSNASKQNLLDINISGYKNIPGTDSRLIRGFSIAIMCDDDKSHKHAKLTYERAYNSRYGRVYTRPVYKVTIKDTEYIIGSTHKVLNFLREYIPNNHSVFNVNINCIKDIDIQNAISRNDIKISRLNKIKI